MGACLRSGTIFTVCLDGCPPLGILTVWDLYPEEGPDGARGEGEVGGCGAPHSICEGKEEEICLDCLA